MKTKLIALMLCMSLMAVSQVKLIRSYDDMSEKVYCMTDSHIVIANESETKGFTVDVIFDNSNRFIKVLYVKMINIGSCNENDKLIILLANNYKMILTNWKKFNCEGICYFNLNKEQLYNLTTYPVIKMKITNGRTFESVTGEVPIKMQSYFIQINNLLKTQTFIEE